MTRAGGEHEALLQKDVEAVLATPGIGIDRLQTGAVILARLDPLRVVWANKAAAKLFESDDADDLFGHVFAGRGREGLAASVGNLVPGGAPRLERLRLIKGFRSQTLVVALSRTSTRDGLPIVVVATPGKEGATEPDADFARPGLAGAVDNDPVESRREAPVGDAPVRVEPPAPSIEPEPPVRVLSSMDDEDVLPGLRERLASVRPARLLWQTDAQHRLVKLTGGIPDMAGIDDPASLGHPLADALRDAYAEADASTGPLAGPMQAKAPWSGLRLRWPLSRLAASAGVTLGAAPIIDKSGGFDGFRGFGVVDLTDLLPLPRRILVRRPDKAVPGGEGLPFSPSDRPSGDGRALPPSGAAAQGPPESRPADQTRADPVRVAVPLGGAGPAGDDATPAMPRVERRDEGRPLRGHSPSPAAPDRSITFSTKVVALRPYQTFTPAAQPGPQFDPVASPEATLAAEPVQPSREIAEPTPEPVDLTASERSNFDAIGRALLDADAPSDDGVEPAAGRRQTTAEVNAARALEALAVAVLVVAADRFVYANPSFLALAGSATLEALGAAGDLSHRLGGLDPSHLMEAAEERVFAMLGANGEPLSVQGRLQPITWDGAQAALLTVRPATDRIAQVQMLEGEIKRRGSELAEMRLMLDRVADSILTVDRKGRILTLNAAAERMFGYAADQAAGEPLAMLVGADAQVAVVDLDSAADEGASGLDVSGRTADGHVLSLHLSWQVLSYGRFCVFLRDQQERSALQRDLAQTKDRLTQVLSSKPEFLAKISHEIRTPLNAILGFAEVILDERFGPLGNDRYRSYLHDIHDSGANVLALVTDLLDLSKMEAGRLEMSPAALDVNRIIGECVAEMQTAAHRERVIVRLSLVPHLTAALVDDRAFRQIMGHILSNAVRFNEPGGQVIVSTAMNEAGAVAVRVRDTGVGMTDAEIATAMEPFGLSRTAQAGSSGLGLPLTRALIEANSATMSIRSQKGEGTLVEILLPSCPAEPMRMPAE